MQDWKFRISGKVIIPGMENQTLNVYPENIKSIVRISDYIGRNEPMMMARMNLDKNFFDIIVKNAKDATLYLKIDKYNANEELQSKTTIKYIEEEFTMVVSSDINYNKDLDYMKAGREANEKAKFNPNDNAKDKYRELIIGLMSKKSIDANKVVANNVFRDTDMMSMACTYMTDLHLLLEPFDYNKTKDQFIMPPKDTLSTTIEYLNSVEVFYSTQYLFFIDEPYCTYLISRSGKGIQKKDEKYKDVFIQLRKSTDSMMAAPGMYEDDKNQRYAVDVPAVRSKYNIDHDSAKLYSELQAVINPNQLNNVDKSNDVLKIQNYINKTVGTFRQYVHNFAKKIGNIGERVSVLKGNFTSKLLDEVNPKSQIINSIQSYSLNSELMPTPTSVGVTEGQISFDVSLVSGAFTSAVASAVSSYVSSAFSQIANLGTMNGCFTKVSDDLIPAYYKATNLDNFLGSVTHINAQDVIAKTTKLGSGIGSASDNITSYFSSNVSGKVSTISNTASSVTAVSNQMQSAKSTIEAIQAGSKYGLVMDQHSGADTNLNYVKENADRVTKWSNEINTACDAMKSTVSACGSIVSDYGKFAGNVTSFTNGLNSIVNVDLKSKFCNIVPMVNQVQGLVNTVNKVNNAMQAFSSISSILSSGTLNLDALKSISENLNKVKDITAIGKTGIPAINVALQLGNLANVFKPGTKLIKTKNDNPNQIKNIKSEIETMVNQVSFSKPGLDPSVFTPNKRYTIKNFDGHSEKDGIFILNKKIETYVREGDNFICTLTLFFSKILEESDTNKSENNAKNESATSKSSDSLSASQALQMQNIIMY